MDTNGNIKIDEYLVPDANYNRLLAEYKRYGSLCIAYDFDSTVHDYHKSGASYETVRQLIRDAKLIGCNVLCWTAYKDLGFVAEFLEKNNIPFDSINEGGIKLPWESKKPFFSLLLDDRAGLRSAVEDLTRLVDTIKTENENINT